LYHHQYLDNLLDVDFEDNKDWGVVGCGLFSARKRQVLEKQDWLQTVVKRDADTVSARVVGCMIDFLPVDNEKREFRAVREKLADPGRLPGYHATARRLSCYLDRPPRLACLTLRCSRRVYFRLCDRLACATSSVAIIATIRFR